MPKYIKLGRVQIETKSLLIGLLVGMVGLSIPQTSSIFTKMLNTVKSFVSGIFKK